MPKISSRSKPPQPYGPKKPPRPKLPRGGPLPGAPDGGGMSATKRRAKKGIR